MAESYSLEQRWDPLAPTVVIRVTSLLEVLLGHAGLVDCGPERNPFAGTSVSGALFHNSIIVYSGTEVQSKLKRHCSANLARNRAYDNVCLHNIYI